MDIGEQVNRISFTYFGYGEKSTKESRIPSTYFEYWVYKNNSIGKYYY